MVELNPLCEAAGSCLFTWHKDRTVLLGAAPDVKLKKRAAFLCNALVASEHCPSGSGKGGSSSSAAGRREYFRQCGGALVSLATGLDAAPQNRA